MKWQTMTAAHAEPGLETPYNLFRRKLAPDLCCALPEDRPVPAFLDGDTWEYAGTLREGDVPPLGFDRAAAELGAQLNGFHLFQMACRPTARPSRKQPRPIIVARSSAGRFSDRIDQSHRPAGALVVNSAFSRPWEDWRTCRMPEGEPWTVSKH